jgi:hypothetical protein
MWAITITSKRQESGANERQEINPKVGGYIKKYSCELEAESSEQNFFFKKKKDDWDAKYTPAPKKLGCGRKDIHTHNKKTYT